MCRCANDSVPLLQNADGKFTFFSTMNRARPRRRVHFCASMYVIYFTCAAAYGRGLHYVLHTLNIQIVLRVLEVNYLGLKLEKLRNLPANIFSGGHPKHIGKRSRK